MARNKSSDRAKIRNDRISLVLPSDASDGIRTLALIQGTSTNDLIVSMIQAVVAKNAGVIERFTAAQMSAAAELNLSLDAEPMTEGGDDDA